MPLKELFRIVKPDYLECPNGIGCFINKTVFNCIPFYKNRYHLTQYKQQQ